MQDIAGIMAAVRAKARGPLRIYVAGGPAEPLGVVEAFRKTPELAADATFLGVWLPGMNTTDWTSIHETARAESFFLYGALREAFEGGRLEVRTGHYAMTHDWLASSPMDAAFLPVSAPDGNGRVSFGLGSDFSPMLAGREDVTRVAVIRPGMPAPQDGPWASLSDFDHVITDEQPLIEVADPPLSQANRAIAAHIAEILQDGDTVQSGIGSVQQLAMQALDGHREMRIHTGMLTDAVMGAVEGGMLADAPGSVVTGTAIGTAGLYKACGGDARFSFRPVSITHSEAEMAKCRGFTAINGAIEVDLMGQVNSEFIGTRQVASTGGLANFVRGAQRAPGGRSIIAFPATARGGKSSRIVPVLSAPVATLARADADIFVTEYGVAKVRNATIDARAEALLSIAAPEFREELVRQWEDFRGKM